MYTCTMSWHWSSRRCGTRTCASKAQSEHVLSVLRHSGHTRAALGAQRRGSARTWDDPVRARSPRVLTWLFDHRCRTRLIVFPNLRIWVHVLLRLGLCLAEAVRPIVGLDGRASWSGCRWWKSDLSESVTRRRTHNNWQAFLLLKRDAIRPSCRGDCQSGRSPCLIEAARGLGSRDRLVPISPRRPKAISPSQRSWWICLLGAWSRKRSSSYRPNKGARCHRYRRVRYRRNGRYGRRRAARGFTRGLSRCPELTRRSPGQGRILRDFRP